MLKEKESSSCNREEAVLCSFLLVGVLGMCGMLFFATTAEATRITSFSEVGDFSTGRNLRMATGDNLLWSLSPSGTPANSVKPDYSTGYWQLGLVDDRDYVVGWATNSSKSDIGYEGWLTGRYSGSATYGLVNGEKPVGAFLVYDSTSNGFDIIGGVVGSNQDLLDGDLFFTEDDIFFGGVLGDVSKLPGYPLSGTAILPNMTVVIPEPATLILLGLGGILIRKRRY